MAYKTDSTHFGIVHPDIFSSPGELPNMQKARIAPYLPVVEYDEYLSEYIVAFPGKIIAKDSLGFLTLAGLKKDIEAGLGYGANSYDAVDVEAGVKEPDGVTTVTAGDKVGDVLINANVSISEPIGVAPTVFYRLSADLSSNPDFITADKHRNTNWNLQGTLTVRCRGVIKIPIISDYANVRLPGVAVVEEDAQNPIKEGDFLTYNEFSDFTKATLTGSNATPWYEVIGKVLHIDTDFPHTLLDRVKSRWPSSTNSNATAQTAGSATGGLIELLYRAGSTKLAYIQLINLG